MIYVLIFFVMSSLRAPRISSRMVQLLDFAPVAQTCRLRSSLRCLWDANTDVGGRLYVEIGSYVYNYMILYIYVISY